MNLQNPNVVYSPIFNDPNDLVLDDIIYFRKQTIKYMITHNILKYHYNVITD